MGIFKNKSLMQQLKRIGFVILGSFILGIGCGLFLIPYNVVSGGVTGITIILHHIFNWDAEIVTTIVTIAFFILGFILLGGQFAVKTIISTIVYPTSVWIGTILWENNLFNLGEINDMNVLLAAIFGGILVGTGVGLTFVGGGSTGGVDVIALALKKYTKIKTSIATFAIDGAIILVGFIFTGKFNMVLIGVMSAFITSLMVDRLFEADRNVAVNIISKKYNEINEYVIKQLDRGSTIITGVGGYSKEGVTILQVVLNYREYYILQDIIAKVDPTAFVSASKTFSVRGEGFKAHSNVVQGLSDKKNGNKEI